MPVRRQADPIPLQHVWDAIRSANAQRQMADMTRIMKYLQKSLNCSQTQAELYVKQSVEDGLILALHKVTVKGSKAGEQVESYKIPINETPLPMKDGNDWYCIDCHLAGNVIPCRMCHRVFHLECAHKNQNSLKSQEPNINNDRNENSQIVEKNTSTPISSPQPKADTSLEENDIINISDDLNNSSNEEDVTDKRKSDTNTECLVTIDDDSGENVVTKVKETSVPENTKTSEEDVKTQLPDINNEEDISSSKRDEGVSLNDKDKYDETLCSICNMCKSEPDLPIEKDELNYLLGFVYNRIKSWLPIVITDTIATDEKPEWLVETEINWRAQQLFYQPLVMNVVERKLQAQEYTRACQFKADVMSIRHNVAIYHGIESQEFAAAEYVRKDCEYDIAELLNCVDCYRHSNEKINNKWFCLPCRTPHKLVWARQKGYPFWPAKVIKIVEDTYDVRFFGGKYERSLLSASQIRAIENTPKDAQGKKGSALGKAIEELKLHQKMLDDPEQLQKYLNANQSKRNPNKPSKALKKVQKQNKSSEVSSKDVYEFEDSPSNGDSSSNFELKTTKRKRSTSPFVKGKLSRTEYQTRLSIQNHKNLGSQNGGGQQNTTSDAISDLDEEGFTMRDELQFGKSCDSSHEEVSSSTERISANDDAYIRENSERLMPQPDRQYCEAIERMGRKMELCSNKDKKQLIKIAQECAQAEIDRLKKEHEEYLKQVFELHNAQISETKKKQWCYNCEQDAIYHCCWNTAYCSPTCQQQHWQAEHKKVCRRKR